MSKHTLESPAGGGSDCEDEGGEGDKLLTVTLEAAAAMASEPASARLVEVGLRFGVPLAAPGREIARGLSLDLSSGTITLITGPSGSGKSSLLNAIRQKCPAARLVQDLPFPTDVAVLDAIAPTRPVAEALEWLTACGLGEPMAWVRRFHELSEGERFRARLARAVSLQRAAGAPLPYVDETGEIAPLLCDEFGAALHQRLARAIAFNLRKLATRERLAIVLATSHDELEHDLHPDYLVRLGAAHPFVERCEPEPHPQFISLVRGLRIQQGTLADYAEFSSMHYRRGTQVGWVDKVFVCREGLDGPVLGVVVYARPTLELRLRNEVTRGRFCKRPAALNQSLRLLKRLVIHPDVRGCGIGHWLVRRTLPMVGTRFVECLAAMGAVNPVFAKAGMRAIGTCEPPAIRDEVLHALRAAGADPLGVDFTTHVCRRPAVREMVIRCVLHWYRATSTNAEEKLARQTPRELAQTFRQLAGSQPVYYLWAADEAGWTEIEQGISRRRRMPASA